MKGFSWLLFFVFGASLLLESIGTYISVVGFSKTFPNDSVILAMAIVLDIAKLVVVSVLYKMWDRLGYILKPFLLTCTLAIMLVTSYGIAGYLSESFQVNVKETTTISITLDNYNRERNKLESRKKDMDHQISQMPKNYITSRQRLLKSFEPELVPLNKRLIELDKKILKLKTDKIEKKLDLGPVAKFADMFDITIDKAISIIILLVVFVFDPLAVALVVVGNMLTGKEKITLIKKKNKHKNISNEPNPSIDDINMLQKSESIIDLMDIEDQKKDYKIHIDNQDIIIGNENKRKSILDTIPPEYKSDIVEDEDWSSSVSRLNYLKDDIRK